MLLTYKEKREIREMEEEKARAKLEQEELGTFGEGGVRGRFRRASIALIAPQLMRRLSTKESVNDPLLQSNPLVNDANFWGNTSVTPSTIPKVGEKLGTDLFDGVDNGQYKRRR